MAEWRTEKKNSAFVAIDRTSQFVYVELLTKYGKAEAAQFLRNIIQAVPDKIHPILTDNGRQFINGKVDKQAWMHLFDYFCYDNKIKHRLTKGRNPWSNGQIWCMNRTLKEATVRRYDDDTHDQLKRHLSAFVNVCNFAKRLKTLEGLTLYAFIIKILSK